MDQPFEQTTRYLSSDRGRLAWLGLGVGLLLACGWLGWLFLAQVPRYIVAHEVVVNNAGIYRARVGPASSQLGVGQVAWLEARTPEVRLLTASVVGVDQQSGWVQLQLTTRQSDPPPMAQAWIKVGHTTPAALLLEAVEQTLRRPRV
ncbi:MAG: hypothetical protein EI684_21925 [Candidatus Viridilinea halotolerans]|uniref:Uncharacterized protein n=1 Tax=Candidatus Viridilinea halotolerans TaxID=2491704 RepID=A0A426TR57_9CHLR|nr:MAG: hypothetical protein EI684_21925 [Candidatus Viridilinea halotolerans]